MAPAQPELKKYLDKRLFVQLNGSRKVIGVLRGYDVFLNIVLDDAVEEKEGGGKDRLGMVVIRGNSVVMLEALERIGGDRDNLDTGMVGPVTTKPRSSLHSASFPRSVLADRYDRTRMIAVASLIYGMGTTLETVPFWLAMFIVGRLLKGVGEGLYLSTEYAQACEIVPAQKMGVMSPIAQFIITPGLLGLKEAEKVELRSRSAEALPHSPDVPFWQSVREAGHDFRGVFDATFCSRTLFGCFLLAFQQFSDIDGALYNAPVLLQMAGITSQSTSFLAFGASAIVIMIVTLPATLLADAWNR
ncbi:hypothetical protein F5Y19DRAFT_485230 [Xylariaceae sp. FL1651]|nr:hypothetical protein F5Y19DRAFT_485230 [Xylariaceae sp. FL1651]